MEDEATAGNGEDDDIAAPVELSPVLAPLACTMTCSPRSLPMSS